MDHDFWHQRWQTNRIGFHQPEVNAQLQQFWPRLELPPGSRVFIPLCGKSLDILWLRDQGFDVVGVELSPIAVQAFFDENSLSCGKQSLGSFVRYQTDAIEIFCGDYFDLTARLLGDVRAVFDRASLIALPPAMRQDYVRHHAGLLVDNVPVLLITLDYDQGEMDGPPFAVTQAEVGHLYGGRYQIECLLDVDVLAREPHFAERGLSRLREKVYLLSAT